MVWPRAGVFEVRLRFGWGRFRVARRDRKGAVALELALLAIPYFMMVLGLCEISFDLFLQAATDLALQAGARQMEIGATVSTPAKGVTYEQEFVNSYICNTTAGRLLICDNIHVKVEVLPAGEDFSSPDVSTGSLPVGAGDTLDLSAYDGTNGVSVFCTAPPGQLILISAIYVGPTFLSGLLPKLFNEYLNGVPVHAVLSQVGVVSEDFSTKGAAPQCS
jgi:Flp pilus assembly protein TadG